MKSKKEKADSGNDSVVVKEELSYEEKQRFTSAISKPMASKKLAKKLYKVIKKASKKKNFLRKGLKDCQRRLRKGDKGIVVLAGDVTPIDIICHLPAVCEELQIPYVYTPSRVDLGTAMGVKRGNIVLMILENEDYKELYDECKTEINDLPLPIA